MFKKIFRSKHGIPHKETAQNGATRLISVVIGSYNRLDLLKKAIITVRTNNIEWPYEMIVVDGGSTDGTMEWLISQKDIITIVQHNRGEFNGRPIQRRNWGYFMNLGFKLAQGKYILMISDDCLLLPGSINRGTAWFEAVTKQGRKIGGVAFYYRNWPVEQKFYVQKTIGGKLMVNHGLFLRKAIEEVGWIDEERYYFYKADGDLCLRIWQAGYEIIDCTDAFIEHFYSKEEQIRVDNNKTLEHDREAYIQRWQRVFPLTGDGKHLPSKVFSEFKDADKTAESMWSN